MASQVPATATSNSTALSATERASLLKKNYPPDLIARIEQRLGQPGPAQPMASHAVSPLTEPRVNVGAEQVGRQGGLTKESVRQVTGPVLDEARGEASPILPKEALTNIIDDMRKQP